MQIDKIFPTKDIPSDLNKIANIVRQPPIHKDSYDELHVSQQSQDYINALTIVEKGKDVDYNRVAQARARQNTQESEDTLRQVAKVILAQIMRL